MSSSLEVSKRQVIEKVMKDVNKLFGAGSLIWAESEPDKEVARIPTGCLSLDLAIGGGIPKGRVTEFYGHEGASKTTLALTVIAQAQKNGELAGYIDMEHALDFDYMQTLGVDLENLALSQPNSAEEALDILQIMVKSGAMSVVVVDSVAALVPQKELDGDTSDSSMGIVARFMSKAMRKITPTVGHSDTAVIFINQVREKIGVVYGNPETTTGGRALRFYATLRLEMKRGQEVKDKDEVLGANIRINVIKNKLFPPGKKVEFSLLYGKGYDMFSDMVAVAIDKGVIKRAGAWFTVGEERFQGQEAVLDYLRGNEEAQALVTAQVYEKIGEQNGS